jgi:hypothetical protein
MNLKPISAFTKVDLVILLAAAGMLTLWVLYGSVGLHRRPRHGARVTCTSNLKQVVLAFSLWQADRNLTNFPWEVAPPLGTAADSASANAFRHFTSISNELRDVRLLTCPADKKQKPALSWQALGNKNISYFINLTPSLEVHSVLAGDRNVSTNRDSLTGYHVISATDKLQWTKLIHEDAGNVGMVDGSVHQITTRQLRQCFTNPPIYLALP